MKEEKLTGIVEGLENQLVFCSDGYDFSFLTCRFLDKDEYITLHPENGIIYATTHTGRKVAIFSGDRDFKVKGITTLKTDLYISSGKFGVHADIKNYRSICLIGGALNQLHPTVTFFDSEDDSNKISIERKQEKVKYHFDNDKTPFDLTIGYSQSGSANKNNYSFTNDVSITLTFESNQPVASFPVHYYYLKLLVSLLTGQSENHFDDIILIPSEDTIGWEFNTLDVHSLNNENAEMSEKMGIPLQLLGEKIIPLLTLFYTSKENKPSYSLGFIPQNNKERWRVSSDRIKSICAALECEANFDKYTPLPIQKMLLNELADKARAIVEESKKKFEKTPILSERTYNLIYGSINHWTISAFDKFSYLYHKYKKSLEKMPVHWDFEVTDDDIQAFIKYRNNIAHGNLGRITERIATTALIMEGLVYCCLFHRIGVSDENIDNICVMYLGRE